MARHGRTSASQPATAADGDPPSLTIDVALLPVGAMLVALRGSIDVLTAEDLLRRIIQARAASRHPVPRLLLDLAEVTFLDQVGLDALLHLQDTWSRDSGTVDLLAPSPSVVRLLHEADRDGASWMGSAIDTPRVQQPRP